MAEPADLCLWIHQGLLTARSRPGENRSASTEGLFDAAWFIYGAMNQKSQGVWHQEVD
jgi:hypothetical protein